MLNVSARDYYRRCAASRASVTDAAAIRGETWPSRGDPIRRPVSPSGRQPVSPSARQPVSPSARQPVSPSRLSSSGRRHMAIRPPGHALLGTARHCSVLLGTARHCSALLGTARHCSALLGTARHCSEPLALRGPSTASRLVLQAAPALHHR